MTGVTFDAGGLIALDRDDRRVIALLARAAELRAPVTIPATALAQAIRNPSKQARLARLVRQPTTRPGSARWPWRHPCRHHAGGQRDVGYH
jgi:hypothetical protein